MSNKKKIKVLFVGSFLSKTKSGGLGGQMFASKTLTESNLNENITWIKIDSTALNNIKTALFIRLFRAILRVIKFTFHVVFSGVDKVLIFTGSGASFKEKGFMALIARTFGKYVIIAPRSGLILEDFKTQNKIFIGKVFSKVDLVICQSESWKQLFQEEFPLLPASKFKVVYNALDTSKYEHIQLTRKEIPHVVFIGWIDRNKGVFELVEAAKKIRDQGVLFKLSMGGHGRDFEAVQSLIRNYNLEDLIYLPGWIYEEEKHTLLSEADIFVLPTYFEGMPNALLEAMAYGIAPLASAVGAIPDIIKQNENGILVQPKDVDELSDALLRLIADRELRENFGSAARKHVFKMHSVEGMVESYREIFMHQDERKTEEYFSMIAKEFDAKYSGKKDFVERFSTRKILISRYAANKKSAYDFGCGTGNYARELAKLGLTTKGFDFSEGMLELAKTLCAREGCNNLQFEKLDLPLQNISSFAKVDVIIGASVLEYLQDPKQCLIDFSSLVNEDGVLIISFPNSVSFHRRMEKIAYFLFKRPRYMFYVKSGFGNKELKEFCDESNFEMVEQHYYGKVFGIYQMLALVLPDRWCNTMFVVVLKKKIDEKRN